MTSEEGFPIFYGVSLILYNRLVCLTGKTGRIFKYGFQLKTYYLKLTTYYVKLKQKSYETIIISNRPFINHLHQLLC